MFSRIKRHSKIRMDRKAIACNAYPPPLSKEELEAICNRRNKNCKDCGGWGCEYCSSYPR